MELKFDIMHKGPYYQLGKGRRDPRIYKRCGTGLVLTHLLTHIGEEVNLDKIAEISGWARPRRQFRERVQTVVNTRSTHYQIERVGKDSYRMTERESK